MGAHIESCQADKTKKEENIVKVGPAIDLNTGKASLKAKPIEDTHVNGSLGENDATPAAEQGTTDRELQSTSRSKVHQVKRRSLRLSGGMGERVAMVISSGQVSKNKTKFVHSSNTARHWRSQHPHLEYSPRKFSNNQNRIQEDEHYLKSNSETASSICSNVWPTKRKSDSYQAERSRKTSVEGSAGKIVATRSSNRIKENNSTITMNGKEKIYADGTPEKPYYYRTRSRRQ